MTPNNASPIQPTVARDQKEPVRRRKRRTQHGGASEDCASCVKRNVKCDRCRPYCSGCLNAGVECPGYKTQLTWNVGVASRGKLRGLSLPIAKSAPVLAGAIQKTSAKSSSRVSTSPTASSSSPSKKAAGSAIPKLTISTATHPSLPLVSPTSGSYQTNTNYDWNSFLSANSAHHGEATSPTFPVSMPPPSNNNNNNNNNNASLASSAPTLCLVTENLTPVSERSLSASPQTCSSSGSTTSYSWMGASSLPTPISGTSAASATHASFDAFFSSAMSSPFHAQEQNSHLVPFHLDYSVNYLYNTNTNNNITTPTSSHPDSQDVSQVNTPISAQPNNNSFQTLPLHQSQSSAMDADSFSWWATNNAPSTVGPSKSQPQKLEQQQEDLDRLPFVPIQKQPPLHKARRTNPNKRLHSLIISVPSNSVLSRAPMETTADVRAQLTANAASAAMASASSSVSNSPANFGQFPLYSPSFPSFMIGPGGSGFGGNTMSGHNNLTSGNRESSDSIVSRQQQEREASVSVSSCDSPVSATSTMSFSSFSSSDTSSDCSGMSSVDSLSPVTPVSPSEANFRQPDLANFPSTVDPTSTTGQMAFAQEATSAADGRVPMPYGPGEVDSYGIYLNSWMSMPPKTLNNKAFL